VSSKKESNSLDEYSIITFLLKLADDDLEKKLIELFSEGLPDEKFLDRILEIMRRK